MLWNRKKRRIDCEFMKLCMDINDSVYIGYSKHRKRFILLGTLKENVSLNQKIVIKTGEELYEGNIISIALSGNIVDKACVGEKADIFINCIVKNDYKSREKLEQGSQLYIYYEKNEKINGGSSNMSMKDIDYENFDLDEELGKVQAGGKPNIFVCGASQVGKSSLINAMFELTGVNAAPVGSDGGPKTRGVKLYQTDDMNLYDSEGYETGEEKQKYYFEEILRYARQPDSCIHEVWYCVNASGKRYLDIDKKIVDGFVREHIPVIIILTQVDNVEKEDLEKLISDIKTMSPDIPFFTYSIYKSKELEPYIQTNEIITWALDHLEEGSGMRARFLKCVKSDLDEKNEHIIRAVIPAYVALAGASVAATSFIPVPFTDSVVLMALQIRMTAHIMKSYNLDYNKSIAADIVSVPALSVLGKTLAGQLAGIIPGVGGFAKGAANVTVATTVTATLGVAISHLSCMYLKKCVNSNGKSNIEFADYINRENLAEAITWANDSGITEGIIAAWKNKAAKNNREKNG